MGRVVDYREPSARFPRRAAAMPSRFFRLVTPFGRAVAGLALAAWVVASVLHWVEFGAVAAGCVLAIAIASVFMLGGDRIAVTIELEPARVSAGQTAGARIEARNATGRRILPFRLEAPAGALVVQSDVPSLRTNGKHHEEFAIPTSRRGVIRVGPVSSVRGDPLGLMRREVAWTESTDLFVHPNTVPLSGIASGWIRDLEGLTTNDLSASDVELHTLRQYEPGDDQRHVHWRTSVRVGTLMVRQFIDTRRWHLAVVFGTSRRDYANDEEFELAVSIAASLGARALRDRQAVSCVAGPHEVPAFTATALLDGLSGVDMLNASQTVADTAIASRRYVRDASVVAVVTGSRAEVGALRLAAEQFPVGMRVVSIRARLGAASSYRPAGITTVVDVGHLDDLERLLRSAGGL
jgi:hypothetical protein